MQCRRALQGALVAVWAVAARVASAADAEVHASSVTFDAGRQELILEGDVRVDSPPFHLRSRRVELRRTGGGPLELKGEGRLAFCPCLGAPFAITFEAAKVAPPADLFLERPTLELFGLPVLWLPAFWLRAPVRPGLLPPDLAYRGADGLYGGLGAHLPWSGGDSSLDLRVGGYTRGGGVIDARFFAPTSQTMVRLDHLGQTGLVVDARGSGGRGLTALSWDVDVLRGQRALLATTRLDDAARPWDRAAAEASWSTSWGRVTTGARSTLTRGDRVGSLGAAGPSLGLGAWGATKGGGLRAWTDAAGHSLSTPDQASGAVHHGVARAGAEANAALGPLAARLQAATEAVGSTGAGDTSGADPTRAGVVSVALRPRLGAPLARRYGEHAALAHVIEPFTTGTLGLRSAGAAPLGVTPMAGDVPDPRSLAGALGLRSALGPVTSRSGAVVEISAGGVSLAGARIGLGGQARATARAHLLGLSGQAAWLAPAPDRPASLFLEAHARLGAEDGGRLLLRAAHGATTDAAAARRLADASQSLAPPLAAAGTSVGGRAVLPIARRVSAMGGADGDLSTPALLGAFGGLELRDSCQCFVVRAFGSGRVGRPGVDMWLTLDVLAPH